MTDVQTTPRLVRTKPVFANSCRTAVFAASNFLRLAATPTFVVMALLTGIHGDRMHEMLCSATRDASLLTGMVPMYVLMSAFHSPPWLKLISRR